MGRTVSMMQASRQGPAAFNFYTLSADNTRLSIDARPYQHGSAIPLGITSSYLMPFVIKMDNLPVANTGQIFLHDKYLQKYQLLNEGSSYGFTISNDPASQGKPKV